MDEPWDITDVFWPFVHMLGTASQEDMYDATFSSRAYVTMCEAVRSGRPLAVRVSSLASHGSGASDLSEDSETFDRSNVQTSMVFDDIDALMASAEVLGAADVHDGRRQLLAACMSRISMWVSASDLAKSLGMSSL
jgi:hypothetical protein